MRMMPALMDPDQPCMRQRKVPYSRVSEKSTVKLAHVMTGTVHTVAPSECIRPRQQALWSCIGRWKHHASLHTDTPDVREHGWTLRVINILTICRSRSVILHESNANGMWQNPVCSYQHCPTSRALRTILEGYPVWERRSDRSRACHGGVPLIDGNTSVKQRLRRSSQDRGSSLVACAAICRRSLISMAISAELAYPNTAEQKSIAQNGSSPVRAQLPLHRCSTAWLTFCRSMVWRHAASASIQSIMWHILTCSVDHQSE